MMIEQKGMARLEIRMRLQCNELLNKRDHRMSISLLKNRMGREKVEEEEKRKDTKTEFQFRRSHNPSHNRLRHSKCEPPSQIYEGSMLPSFVTAAGVEASKAFVAILRNFSQTFAEQKQAFDAWGGQYNATEQVNEWYQNITTKADANTQDIIAKMATVLQKMQELKDANPEMTIAEYFEAVKAWVNSTNDENTRAAARWVMMIRGESLGFGEKCHKMGGHSHGGDSHERTEDDRTGGERNGSGGRRDREGNHREGGRGSRRHGHSRGTRATRSWTHRRGTGKTTKTPKATARAG
ncbi:hypothetical protein WR25_17012 [Diploscapter pachys]|uniref:SXP/RAL-2 family protein Ani s 5-like cation-binding domain-containing protein n=1 Tax=Diploscapter pachys TaxID=2018661 RepID=A0A2A2KZU8_9BILA|nr:hypothetical protein WR25_17012 [Diploscapter pachys]